MKPSPRSPLLLSLALLASGCVSIRPWTEATSGIDRESFVEVDGHQVHIERSGRGEPLVLLHGFGESTLTYSPIVPELAKQFDVVALDFHGFGFTQRPRDVDAYTLAGQAGLVLGVLDRLGLERVRLAGHSYGGGIALYLAAEHPERVHRLLLIDNTLPLYVSQQRGKLLRWRWLADLAVRTVGLRDGRITTGLEEAYFDDSQVTSGLVQAYAERLRIEGAADAYRGLLGPSPEPPYEIDLAAIRQPTLIIWGAEDDLIPMEIARAQSAKLPHGSFASIPLCGHTPMEECPAEFLAAALPFLTAP